MREINLGYGRSSVVLPFDEERYQILGNTDSSAQALSDLEIGLAFDAPIGSPPLEEIVSPGDSVLIVVSDATRATASAQIVNLLVRRLIQSRVSPSDIAIIFATGIHRPVSVPEKQDLLTPFIFQRVQTIDHDPYDPTQLHLADLPCGTPIRVNRALKAFSRVIIIGGIGFHYFAGFTGGRKSICPGLASAETIKATHMLALDFENGGRRDGVGAGLLDENAVHNACDYVANLISPAFCINTVVDDLGRAVQVYAGGWRASHRVACDEYLASHSHRIGNKRELVVTSCGGFPWDINLIQAHKALEMASFACSPGGTIILLAECGDGLGNKDFLKWFDSKDSALLEARLRQSYEVNGQTAWSLMLKTEKFQIVLVSSFADDDVRKMRMVPMPTLYEAIRSIGGNKKGYIMPRGAAVLPVPGMPPD
jgi:nickel-dependent lactate racemase